MLGNDDTEIAENIDCIKGVENGRLQKFHENNPDMFLPINIDVDGGEMSGTVAANYSSDSSDDQNHISEDGISYETPWFEVSGRSKSSRRKISFKT